MSYDKNYQMSLIHKIYCMAEGIDTDYDFDKLWSLSIEELERKRDEIIALYNKKLPNR